ncbi:MAG: DEAD/DEAH box helicase family protein [Ignavibacteria bacterium]|nr:DEAD/DEAH box helicase family protein [Ignavibacteria bacterium]
MSTRKTNHSSDTSFPPSQLLDERVLATGLRSYQQEALDLLLKKYGSGERRLHVVAPPGSGKTILGVAFVQAARLRSVVLSPNAAIQAQWMDKYGKATADIVDTRGDVWGGSVAHLISDNPETKTPILSLTYQRIAAQDRSSGELHRNVEDLFRLIIDNDYRCLILDECHHLVAVWADVISGLLARHDMVVLGLTATPPVDRGNRELSAYLDLVGDVDFQIPMPAVIKEGNLAPFQDLVHLVHPGDRERRFIQERHERFHALLDELNVPDPDLPTLTLWVDDTLDTKRWKGRRFGTHAEFLQEHTAAGIALGRYARKHHLNIPSDMPVLDEMEEPPDLDDIALLLGEYLADALLPIAGASSERRATRIAQSLHDVGFVRESTGFVRRQSSIDRVLALSSAKLVALKIILAREIENLADAIRALVITDFETANTGGPKSLDGVLDPEAGGAVAAMRAITSDPAVDTVDPVMITGSAILCDDDLAGRLLTECRAIIAREGWDAALDAVWCGDGNAVPEDIGAESTRGFFRIEGTGRDWGTRIYVLMLTELFDRGVTRCLIGTRGLLGEGWDSLTVNVLVDLTAVAGYVSVNQVQGRSLRLDPAHREKVSNNWDVVALLPEFPRGFADWDRFLRKHQNLFGLSDDGELERGVGHVHPALTHVPQEELAGVLETVNADMLRRSADRASVRRAWRIGEPFDGREFQCLELRPTPATPRVVADTVAAARAAQEAAVVFRGVRRRVAGVLGVAGTAAYAASASMGLLPESFLLSAAAIPSGMLLAVWAVQRLVLHARKAAAPALEGNGLFRRLGEAVRDTIVALREGQHREAASPELVSTVRNDGSMRLWIDSDIPGENELFSRALGELLQPLQDQRYVLQTYDLPIGGLPLRKVSGAGGLDAHYRKAGIAPVPSDFARKRDTADVFHKQWERLMGKADLLFAKKGDGAALLREHMRQRFIPCGRYVKTLWR